MSSTRPPDGGKPQAARVAARSGRGDGGGSIGRPGVDELRGIAAAGSCAASGNARYVSRVHRRNARAVSPGWLSPACCTMGMPVRDGVCQRDARGVPSGADDQARPLTASKQPNGAPGARRATQRSPVLPGLGAIQRMEVEQQVRKLGRRQHLLLDAALGADEERAHLRLEADEGPRDGEAGIQVSASSASGEKHGHRLGRSGHAQAAESESGSVARSPMTRSLVLPMFTRIPVRNIVSTMFERPYDTNGSVSPVVGSSPITTPMCR